MSININYSKTYRLPNGAALVKRDLKDVLDEHNGLVYKSKEQYGGLYCYLNPIKGESDLDFSGLFFIDLDTKGDNEWISNKIFSHSQLIFEKMPNVVCIKFSFNKGIHIFVHDSRITGSDISIEEYRKQSQLWTAYLCRVVKYVCDVDLLKYKTSKGTPVVDTHNTNPYQLLGLCNSPYAWNEYKTDLNLGYQWENLLYDEYPSLFKNYKESNPNKKVSIDTNSYREGLDTVFNKGVPRKINAEYEKYGLNGNDLRKKIAMCLLIRFDWNVEDAMDLCYKGFDEETAKQISAWIKTYSRKDFNGSYGFAKWMNWLFKSKGDYVELKRDQFLNDVLDIDEIEDKYVYIISNTGTGKTEWIKRMVDTRSEVIAVSPNLAILEGKKSGDGIHTRDISDKTFNNRQDVNDAMGMSTTMEQVAKMKDVRDKILIIDEAHLLSTYLGISKKLNALEKILNNINEYKKVIFLSATPSGEQYIANFKMMRFIKITNAHIITHLYRMNNDGWKNKKGGVLVPCYKYIIDQVMKEKNCIVYSNKRRSKWNEAGIQQLIDGKIWGEYNSTIKDNKKKNECYESLKSENGNVLLYDWVFATCYLGVGVEIKYDRFGNRVKEGHIYFFVDEGFDTAFIEQCIGRFRDREDEMIYIHVHLYYTKSNQPCSYYALEEMKDKCNEYYKEAVGWEDEWGNYKYNILMQRFFNVYNTYNPELNESVHDSVAKMMAYKVYNEKHHCEVEEIVDHIQKLPYKKVDVMNEVLIDVNPSVRRYDMKEREFEKYICGLPKGTLGNMLESYTTTDLLCGMTGFDIPYKNEQKVRKYIDILRKIYMKGWNVYEWVKYVNGEVSKVISMYKLLNGYIGMKGDEYVLDNKDDFYLVGVEEKLKSDAKKAEEVFEKEFLQNVISKIGCEWRDKIDTEIDPIFASILDLEEDDEARVKVFLDLKDKQSISGKKGKKGKKIYEIAMSDKLEKYGLKKGMRFEGKKSILEYVKDVSGKSIDETYIDRWRKNRFIIAY